MLGFEALSETPISAFADEDILQRVKEATHLQEATKPQLDQLRHAYLDADITAGGWT